MDFFFKSLAVLAALASPVSSAAANDDLVAGVRQGAELRLAMPEKSDNPQRLVKLAARYEHGEGLPRDYSKAIELYCQAAKWGSADAQYALGWMYANGRGMPRDDGVAARLFAMAAEQGHSQAQNMVRYTRSSSTAPPPTCLQSEKEAAHAEDMEHVTKDAIAEETASQNKDKGAGDVPRHSGEVVYLKSDILNLVHQLAPSYEVDPKLVLAVISVESGFNARAQSPKNAQGLMQLIPETAQRFRVKDAFDAKENIKGGLAYLQWLLAFFKGSVPLAVAAYNAGEKAVEKYRGIPPYPETQDYVRRIARLYKKTDHPYRRNLVEASSITPLPVNLGR